MNSINRTSLKRGKTAAALVIVTLSLILQPAALLARSHTKSELRQHDAAAKSKQDQSDRTFGIIAPPPDEAPPPPPPSADQLNGYIRDQPEPRRERSPYLYAFNADRGYVGRVLELPRLPLEVYPVMAGDEKYPSPGSNNYDKMHPRDDSDYSDYDQMLPPESEPPAYVPTRPPSGFDYPGIVAPPAGFVPFDPHEMVVRPGEGGPISPTSPLLSLPPGAAARP